MNWASYGQRGQVTVCYTVWDPNLTNSPSPALCPPIPTAQSAPTKPARIGSTGKQPESASPNPQLTFTCVFRTGTVEWAWFDGNYTSLTSSKGAWIGKTVRFSPASFYNCSAVMPGAVPLGTTEIRINRIDLCTFNTGKQQTFVNSSCPNYSN